MKYLLLIFCLLIFSNKAIYPFSPDYEDDGYYPGKSEISNLEPDTNHEPTKPQWYKSEVLDEASYYLPIIQGASLNNDIESLYVPPQECISTYKNLYANQTLKISIFFGYADSEKNIVFDRYQKKALIEHFLKPCSYNYFACGMENLYVTDNTNGLYKFIIGPDGKKKLIIVDIVDSSVSDFDNWNINELIHEQVKKSNKTLLAFEKSLIKSDVVFYKGHSRKGSGPGFTPLYRNYLIPILKRYFKYYSKRMSKRLKSDGNLKLFGFLGCLSKKYYEEVIKIPDSNVGLILLDFKSKVAETNFILLASINSLLGMKCENDFIRSLNLYKHIRPDIFKDLAIPRNVELKKFFN